MTHPLHILCASMGIEGGNPYVGDLVEALQAHGATVLPLTSRSALRADANAALVHWPEFALKRRSLGGAVVGVAQSLAKILLLRARQIPVVWTVHNLTAHDGRHPLLERIFWRIFTALVSAHISLSEAGLRAAVSRFPTLARKPGVVVRHPHYRLEMGTTPQRDSRRSELGFGPAHVVLGLVGRIAPYKGAVQLAAAFTSVSEPDSRLALVGPVDPALRDELADLAAQDERIALLDRSLDAEEFLGWTTSMDLIVVPHRGVLNSGTALYALSAGRPILVPDSPALVELASEVGGGWVSVFRMDSGITSEDLQDALRSAERLRGRPAPPLAGRTWDDAGAATCRFIASLSGPR